MNPATDGTTYVVVGTAGTPRYDDYGFIALDVVPARHGARTTMTLRFINQQGRELDRVVLRRIAGRCPEPPPS